MKKIFSSALLLLFFPFIALAQDIQSFLVNFIQFLNGIIIPFLFAIAFFAFVFNAFRFFILGSTNEEEREKAKALAIYSVLAFTFLIVFWGIINILAGSLELDGETQPPSDYVKLMTT